MTNQIRIVHVLSNLNFTDWISKCFDSDKFQNLFIILSNSPQETTADNFIHVGDDKAGLERALTYINDSDFCFHYFLDYLKSELILKSNSRINHYWCFFGADVYQTLSVFRSNLYGEETKKWFRLKPFIRYRILLRKLKYRLLLRKTPEQIFIEATKKIKAILWYIDDEIKWISQKIQLPPFIHFQFFEFKDLVGSFDPMSDTEICFWIGNSATIENNHLDVLKILKTLNTKDYKFTLPLSYGQFPEYKKYIKKEYTNFFNDRVQILDKFVPLAEYNEHMSRHSVAIMLHFRQQGLGNIFYFIANGSTVYLSEKNIIYSWLVKNGIHVRNFEKEFISDFNNDNLLLTAADRENNYLRLESLLSQESTLFSKLNELKIVRGS